MSITLQVSNDAIPTALNCATLCCIQKLTHNDTISGLANGWKAHGVPSSGVGGGGMVLTDATRAANENACTRSGLWRDADTAMLSWQKASIEGADSLKERC